MTTRSDIREWLEMAQAINTHHMIVTTDTFDYSDYKELHVSPCKPDCRYLAMMMEMANEEEVPVERRYEQ